MEFNERERALKGIEYRGFRFGFSWALRAETEEILYFDQIYLSSKTRKEMEGTEFVGFDPRRESSISSRVFTSAFRNPDLGIRMENGFPNENFQRWEMGFLKAVGAVAVHMFEGRLRD